MRISRLEIQGFRSFGPSAVEIDLDETIIILEGENSHGKTSIAEALEFLLTGDISRRLIAGSAADEFEDCLRNAHLEESIATYVEADIVDQQSRTFRVRRTLIRDAGRNSPPTAELLIDGQTADDLASTGFTLSVPPIQAPILLQHNIRYLLSARPQERMDYFKAVLDLSAIEELRTAISRLESPSLDEHDEASLARVYRVVGQSDPAAALRVLRTAAEDGAFSDGVLKAVRIWVAEAGVPLEASSSAADLRSAIEAEASRRRDAAFPLTDLLPGASESQPPPPEIEVETYNTAVATADRSVSELLALFSELLRVPVVQQADQAIDCPVCETPHALTLDRVSTIQRHVDSNSGFTDAQTAMERSLNLLKHYATTLKRCAATKPALIDWDSTAEETIALAQDLAGVGDEVRTLLAESLALESMSADLEAKAQAILELADTSLRLSEDRQAISAALAPSISGADAAATAFEQAKAAYSRRAEPVHGILASTLASQSGIQALDDALEVFEDAGAVEGLLRKAEAYEIAALRLQGAKRDMDTAVQTLLERRFLDMSDEITRWWNLLRPGDPTSFDRLEHRGTGRRFLDLKARLSTNNDSVGSVRNAIAVLGDSQLGALGLSTFLARCIKESTGFVVLDDPLAGFDDEHRATFANSTLGELAAEGMQLIVATYDRRLSEQAKRTHDSLGTSQFSVTMNKDRDSTIVVPLKDLFDELYGTAYSLHTSGVIDHRRTSAEKGRKAAERSVKQAIAGHKRSQSQDAFVTDLDGKSLVQLVDRLAPYYLSRDERGKWLSMAAVLNPGNHDDDVPSSNDLAQALGDLRAIRKSHRENLGDDWPD